MKIAALQMNVREASPEENLARALSLLYEAAKEKPDLLILPETWNTGFFPREGLSLLCDREGQKTKEVFGNVARERRMNIIAGSVSDLRDGRVYNSAYIFNRQGDCIASYDKTHLFSPMGENEFYTPGNHLCNFVIDSIPCSLLLCYDIRFPELARKAALGNAKILFLPSQWPDVRMLHLETLLRARAIENQFFTVGCNAAGRFGDTVFGGGSTAFDPWGNLLYKGGSEEEILYCDLDLAVLDGIREKINVFKDRRDDLCAISQKEGSK